MRIVCKIENGSIDPVKLAEQIEQIGTRFRLITDGDPMDLTSPFIAAMLFTLDSSHSLVVAVDDNSFKECDWKYVLHKAELTPVT